MNYYDIDELAREVCGVSEEADDVDLDDAIYEKFECSYESFFEIVKTLLPLCVVGESPLSGKVYRGFGKDGLFFLKQEDK